MKTRILTPLKAMLSDRLLTALVLLLVVACLVYCIYIGISLRPSDLQVAVHYTAYGDTGFYREKWYYLITFIVFGLLVACTHTALIIKMYLQGRRQIALMFAWLSLLLVAGAFLLTNAVLNVAFL